MAQPVKFSSKMDREVLDALRAHAAETSRTLSSILTEAAASYLAEARLRPAFRDAAANVLDEHAELMQRLAK